MTPNQVLAVLVMLLVIIGMLALLVVRSDKSQTATRRPLYLVVIPVFGICSDDRKRLRDDLSADLDRDYVFVETKQEESIKILEIA